MATSSNQQKRLLLRPADVPPSRDDLETIGVFNPGVMEHNGEVLVLARVAERPKDQRPDEWALPRWDPTGKIAIDTYARADGQSRDARVVHVLSTDRTRLTFTSYLRLVNCGASGIEPRVECTLFMPYGSCEEFGVEDPRITRIGDCYYITYVAVSRHGAATALASTNDFQHFARHGIILPPENKDVVLFPERVQGRYCCLHRPTSATPFTAPEIWIGWSDDLEHWGHHEPLLLAEGREWSSARVGAGAPPIRVNEGWLVIYHGSRRSTTAGQVGQYVAAAMLLDANEPARIIAESTEALFLPTEPFESEGFVPDVVFPTGTIVRGDKLLVYYGAGDTNIGVVTLSLAHLLKNLTAPR